MSDFNHNSDILSALRDSVFAQDYELDDDELTRIATLLTDYSAVSSEVQKAVRRAPPTKKEAQRELKALATAAEDFVEKLVLMTRTYAYQDRLNEAISQELLRRHGEPLFFLVAHEHGYDVLEGTVDSNRDRGLAGLAQITARAECVATAAKLLTAEGGFSREAKRPLSRLPNLVRELDGIVREQMESGGDASFRAEERRQVVAEFLYGRCSTY